MWYTHFLDEGTKYGSMGAMHSQTEDAHHRVDTRLDDQYAHGDRPSSSDRIDVGAWNNPHFVRTQARSVEERSRAPRDPRVRRAGPSLASMMGKLDVKRPPPLTAAQLRKKEVKERAKTVVARLSALHTAPGSLKATAMKVVLAKQATVLASRMVTKDEHSQLERALQRTTDGQMGGAGVHENDRVQRMVKKMCGATKKHFECLNVLFEHHEDARESQSGTSAASNAAKERLLLMVAVGKAQSEANIPLPAINVFMKKPLQKVIRHKVNKMRSVFAAYDVEGAGEIHTNDVERLMEASGIHVEADELAKIMDSMTQGTGGKVDVVQFTAHMPLILEMHYKVASYKLKGFG
jgi:Ca2+-binding EF-hand superfamily protein